jgi:hypothetical protein
MKSYWKPASTSGTTQKAYWGVTENWTPQGVPTSQAFFGEADYTVVGFLDTDCVTTIDSIEFDDNALGYTFCFDSQNKPGLTIQGDGVLNSSGVQQSFVISARSSGYSDPQLVFKNKATAGGDDLYYCVGPENDQDYGGGVLNFQNQSNAGSARFKVWTGAGVPPKKGSTVGGEVAFSNDSSAESARFVIYGTLGTDGDTFGNVVFHDTSTAANAFFENIGGTVSRGDGGNTQFYGTSTAANGIFYNYGGTHSKANGGDVAFDTQADGAQGTFHNYAAPAKGAYGGVTSFNNNWPYVDDPIAASAGNGYYINYGARQGQLGGGGHLSFSAKYGSPTAANAVVENYGSTIDAKSSAGHTIFSVDLSAKSTAKYFPTAGNATIYNHSGEGKGNAAGYTAFSVYNESATETAAAGYVPTAAKATIVNYGGNSDGTIGGYTVFSNNTTAGEATLIAHGGTEGGYGGKIAFYDDACGSNANIVLDGNGELELGYHTGDVGCGTLTLTGGFISVQIGTEATGLSVAGELTMHSSSTTFSFWSEGEQNPVAGKAYKLLTASNLSQFDASNFKGNAVNDLEPQFNIVGNELQVSFSAQ